MNFFLMSLVASVLGGSAFATELNDGSSEFLRILPVEPRTAGLSKLFVLLGGLLLLWIPIVASQLACVVFLEQAEISFRQTSALRLAITSSLGAFGVSWLLSARIPSPSIASAAGLLAPILIAIVAAAILDTFFANVDRADQLRATMQGCVAICLAAVGCGQLKLPAWYP